MQIKKTTILLVKLVGQRWLFSFVWIVCVKRKGYQSIWKQCFPSHGEQCIDRNWFTKSHIHWKYIFSHFFFFHHLSLIRSSWLCDAQVNYRCSAFRLYACTHWTWYRMCHDNVEWHENNNARRQTKEIEWYDAAATTPTAIEWWCLLFGLSFSALVSFVMWIHVNMCRCVCVRWIAVLSCEISNEKWTNKM